MLYILIKLLAFGLVYFTVLLALGLLMLALLDDTDFLEDVSNDYEDDHSGV